MEAPDARLGRWLAVWTDAMRRRAVAVVAVVLAATLGLGAFTATHLGVNADGVSLISPELPTRRNHDAFAALFPNLENALLIVIDAATPGLARESADTLAAALRARPEAYDDVYQPGGGAFFERNGLLYRDLDQLDHFAGEMARIQPFVAELRRDPGVAHLSELVREGLVHVRNGGGGEAQWAEVLDRVGRATVTVYEEYPIAVSWEELLLRGSAVDLSTRRVLIVHPILDFQRLLVAQDALAEIREISAAEGLVPERGVRVRITGNPALNTEEFIGLMWDILGAGVICFLVVVVVLHRALRSLPLVVAGVATLLVGLVWTAAFAAAAIGSLNLVSLAFAVLFIGLGVDFQIHLGMAVADRLREGDPQDVALRTATAEVGPAQVLCAGATAVGFYVFVPTDYLGVAELGLIAGTGMLIILGLTFSFFPAVLAVAMPAGGAHLSGRLRFHAPWWHFLAPRARAIRWLALGVGVVSVAATPLGRFDANVVRLRDPATESVQAFDDLLESRGTASPWYLNAVAEDLPSAERLARRLDALPEVSETLVLADFVPKDQEDKVEILSDIAFVLDVPAAPPPVARLSTAEQIDALRELRDFLSAEWIEAEASPLTPSIRALREHLDTFLERVERDGDGAAELARLDDVLLGKLPAQIDRLLDALAAEPISLDDLPGSLVARMLTPEGRARIQIFPTETLRDEASFAQFTDSVQTLAPLATGVAANLLAFGRATKSSFQQALVSAAIGISLLLWILWRRPLPVLLVMAPLSLASFGTAAALVALDVPWNFGNVLVIPLLMGVGVDSGIHLVRRAELEAATAEELLSTTTARAVFYSALTTTVSFGSLALSSHRGMQSLGVALSIGMALMVIANLVVLPAILELRSPRRD